MNRRGLLTSVAMAVAVCAVPLVGTVAPVDALATTTTALYDMNEAAGNAVLVDSSGNGVNGASGPNVSKGVLLEGATVHSYSRFTGDGVTPRSPTMLPVEPERLDTVPHSTLLNPDSQDFAITVRYRTSKSFGNLVQKGQNGTVGGYFKIELPGGRPTCLFKGVSNGRTVQRAVEAPLTVDLSDNIFHTIRCERLVNRVTLFIDGVEVKRLVGSSGNIANTKNLSIAGKSNCDQVLTTCDYFIGDIDWVRIEKGTAPDPNDLPNAAFTSKCTAAGVCTFDASGSRDPDGTIASYQWDFGDLTTATGQKPSHTFVPGDFLVALVITDNDGGSSSVEKTISIAAPPTTTIVAQEPPPPGRVTEVKGAATGLQVAQRLPVVTGE
jgi:PKD domain/Laminin G domain